MEECSVLIETTKSAEDKTSRWFDLPSDYELFHDLLGVEADNGDYQICAIYTRKQSFSVAITHSDHII